MLSYVKNTHISAASIPFFSLANTKISYYKFVILFIPSSLQANTHVFLFGGKPFEEERYIFWNFVSSSQEKIEQAKKDWESRSFPKVPSDHSYIPLPKTRLKLKKK